MSNHDRKCDGEPWYGDDAKPIKKGKCYQLRSGGPSMTCVFEGVAEAAANNGDWPRFAWFTDGYVKQGILPWEAVKEIP